MSSETFGLARGVVDAFRAGLALRSGEGVDETLRRLSEQDITEQTFVLPAAQQKPVCRHLADTLLAAGLVEGRLAQSLGQLAPLLRWVQTSSYTDDVLGPGFTENYAWCEIIGAQGFFSGDDFNLGFLLLGPERHYLDHYHPAPELYWPLTEPSKWKKGSGMFEAKSAGSVIWHPSMTVHATITEHAPLLAAYAWTQDAAIGARLCILDKREA